MKKSVLMFSVLMGMTLMGMTLVGCQMLTSQSTSTAQSANAANALQFDVNHYKALDVTVDNQTIKVRAYENIVYVANPVDTAYQSMNIYIPENYFEDKSINGYTADTAPIFMPNAVGGYMPARPMTVGVGRDGKPNSVAQDLHRFCRCVVILKFMNALKK